MASVEILDESIFSGSSGGDEDCLHVILKLKRPDYISLVVKKKFSIEIKVPQIVNITPARSG